jgi:hypothetical protein
LVDFFLTSEGRFSLPQCIGLRFYQKSTVNQSTTTNKKKRKTDMSPELLNYLKNADRTFLIDSPELIDYEKVAIKVFSDGSKKELSKILSSLMEVMRIDIKTAKTVIEAMVSKGIIKASPNPFFYQMVGKQLF